MGCNSSKSLETDEAGNRGTAFDQFAKQNANRCAIGDNYKTLDELRAALRHAGLETSQLTVGIDFTRSNLEQGARTFAGRSLHDITGAPNPYEQVFRLVFDTLVDRLDDDGAVDVYGFGDSETRDRAVFSFNGFRPISRDTAIATYRQIVSSVRLSGPTSFAPLIRETMSQVHQTGEYRVLVIIADGCVNDSGATRQAIIEASEWPISIIMIGVGDGPFDMMHAFDDDLRESRFDNFQFVDFHAVMAEKNSEIEFVRHALMELPMQYQYIKSQGLMSRPHPAPVSVRVAANFREVHSAPLSALSAMSAPPAYC